MSTGQITWDYFRINNNNSESISFKFEDLCRQLFMNEFLSGNKVYRYVHSIPNNPGIESEPIYDEVNERWVGYQAKYFDNKVGYEQILHSAEEIVKFYRKKVNHVFLFCNKSITVTAPNYKKAVNILAAEDITIEPITNNTILDLVRKYPYLGTYYFGEYSLDHNWFVRYTNKTFSELGERFNKDFNVDTIYSMQLSLFIHDKKALEYLNGKKKELLSQLDKLYWRYENCYQFQSKIRETVLGLQDVKEENICESLCWEKRICDAVAADIDSLVLKKEELQKEKDGLYLLAFDNSDVDNDISMDSLNGTLLSKKEARDKYYKIDTQLKMIETLLELPSYVSVTDMERKLLEGKNLVVKGEAGIGKSQMLANETAYLIDSGKNALLLTGGSCFSNDSIQEQIMKNLSIRYSFDDLIDAMEAIGEAQGCIVPLFVDALNETWNKGVWKVGLPSIMEKINSVRYVRLVISYRSEYEKLLVNETLINKMQTGDINCIYHQGFAENTIEAAEKFLNYYGIPFTPLECFGYEMSNPLFLTLYCKTYKGDEVALPTLYNRILEYANINIFNIMSEGLRASGYTGTEDLVSPFVEELSEYFLKTGKRSIGKQEIFELNYWRNYKITPVPFINCLIKEHILHDHVYGNEERFYFAYDQMNDYYCARAVMSRFQSKQELKNYLAKDILYIENGKIKNYGNRDIFINICVLYAEKYQEECIGLIDMIDDDFDKSDIFSRYISSYQWRKKESIFVNNLRELLEKYKIHVDDFWKMLISNCTKCMHPLNADFFHELLLSYELNWRDYLWTTYINEISWDESNRIVQLIKMYNRGEHLDIKNNRQIELLLTLFGWILTSSNRWLRDITSKAMIEILKVNFSMCEYLLEKFKDVNDPYVIQRLYGVVFGACCKCLEKEYKSYKSLAEFVYKNVFGREKVYPDILLRDYARLIVERFLWENPEYEGAIIRNNIVPPYVSDSIPLSEDKNYINGKYGRGISAIISSMCFEGMGMYGDFGRYVFQRELRSFEVDKEQIFNYAMSFILDELGYEEDFFGKYDCECKRYVYNRHNTVKVERIGKKYQWIAMYNILARVSDYYKLVDGYGDYKKEVPYEGAWDLHVRDFDPTLNNQFMNYKAAPFFNCINEHVEEVVKNNVEIILGGKSSENTWLEEEGVFFKYMKDDLILKDDNGCEWITLTKYQETRRDNLKEDKLLIWSGVYGFFVTEEQAHELQEFANKKIDIRNHEFKALNETYVIFNREYPWSPGCKSIKKYAWKSVKIPTGEIELVKEKQSMTGRLTLKRILKEYGIAETLSDNEGTEDTFEELEMKEVDIVVEKEVEKEIGEILSATTDLSWEEQYDASKEDRISRRVPCAELIEKLKLREMEYDGFYFDEQGNLGAFDADLNGQDAGCLIRKDLLDTFLENQNMKLIWVVNASKESHLLDLSIGKWSDWTSVLVYDGERVLGEIYKVNRRR